MGVSVEQIVAEKRSLLLHVGFWLWAIAIGFVLPGIAIGADDSFRCGSDLVSLGDTMYEVRHSCGEPYSAQIIGERRTFRILRNKRYKLETLKYLTEWIYEHNDGIYVLTFAGSRLVEKEFIFH